MSVDSSHPVLVVSLANVEELNSASPRATFTVRGTLWRQTKAICETLLVWTFLKRTGVDEASVTRGGGLGWRFRAWTLPPPPPIATAAVGFTGST